MLKKQGFVRIRLTDAELKTVHELYAAAQDALIMGLRRSLAVARSDMRRLDTRSGYVDDVRREFFELHPAIAYALPESAPGTGGHASRHLPAVRIDVPCALCTAAPRACSWH